MPDNLKDKKITILCNDCLKTSEVKYHFIGSKCLHCQSYNTSRCREEERKEEIEEEE